MSSHLASDRFSHYALLLGGADCAILSSHRHHHGGVDRLDGECRWLCDKQEWNPAVAEGTARDCSVYARGAGGDTGFSGRII